MEAKDREVSPTSHELSEIAEKLLVSIGRSRGLAEERVTEFASDVVSLLATKSEERPEKIDELWRKYSLSRTVRDPDKQFRRIRLSGLEIYKSSAS